MIKAQKKCGKLVIKDFSYQYIPEGYCEVHKISGLITNRDNSWLWVDYSAIVIFYFVHAVDDMPLGAVIAVWANNINLKKELVHEYSFKIIFLKDLFILHG